MLFNSVEFVLFIAIVLPLYALLRGRLLRVFLIIASYIFYGWANPFYCLLLLASTVLDFNIGQRMNRTENERTRRYYLFLSLAGNIGLLGVFKYSGFFVNSINDIASVVGVDLGLIAPTIILPVGISFYTFQTLSYTIDIYQRKMEPTDDFLSFALFVSFFPQLVAGPIERARDLLPQLMTKQPTSTDDILAGITRILWGMMKKIVIADNIAIFVNEIYGSLFQSASNAELILATWLFAFQIYFDFSAYSDIAIGLARLMGIHINENFIHPYVSRNVSEFWRRWHISLSTWLRDYLYFPLGGSRQGIARTLMNVVIVFFLGGLWHGADVKFIIWGLWIGLAIGLYNLGANLLGVKHDWTRRFYVRDLIGIFITFQIISVSWVFFRADSMGQAIEIFERLLSPDVWANGGAWEGYAMSLAVRWLVFLVITHLIRGIGITQPLQRIRNPYMLGIFWGVLIAVMMVFFANTSATFIYFQF